MRAGDENMVQRITDTGVDEEDIIGSESIKQPYDPGRINVVRQEMTVFQVLRKIMNKEINLEPDFQRNLVWDETRQSRLIESILIRIPLPSFYMDATNDDEWLIIDGLQRLSTLHRYVNEEKFSLQGLEFLEELKDKKFNQLPRSYQRRIEETPLLLYIIRPETPSEAKFTIFRRINTGGMVLTAQEIRHCLYRGKSTELLKELASSPEFRKATSNSVSPDRMDDRECVIRFFAFYLTPYHEYQKRDFDTFLGDTMVKINQMSDNELAQISKAFKDAMIKAEAVFGKNAFRKPKGRDQRARNPINKALFEVWSVCLQKYPLDVLLKNREKINEKFIYYMNNDPEFVNSISQGTGEVKKVHKRFEVIENVIREGIN